MAHSRILPGNDAVYSCDWCDRDQKTGSVLYYYEVYPVVFGYSETMDMWDVRLCETHMKNVRRYSMINITNKTSSVFGRAYDEFLVGEKPVGQYY